MPELSPAASATSNSARSVPGGLGACQVRDRALLHDGLQLLERSPGRACVARVGLDSVN